MPKNRESLGGLPGSVCSRVVNQEVAQLCSGVKHYVLTHVIASFADCKRYIEQKRGRNFGNEIAWTKFNAG